MDRRQWLQYSLAGTLGATLAGCHWESKPLLRLAAHPWPGYEFVYLARDLGMLDPNLVRLIETPAATANIRALGSQVIEASSLTLDEVLTTRATVLKNLKGVTVDGKPVKAAEPTRIFVFHKPAGLITAERDPAGRPTIYTALRNALPAGTPRLMPVGRLDLDAFVTEEVGLGDVEAAFERMHHGDVLRSVVVL